MGIAAGFANAPLTYTWGSQFGGGSFDGCGGQCRAEADITQDTIFIRGGGYGNFAGFHGVYVAEVVDFVLHHQGSAVVAQTAPRFFTLRAGFRVGFEGY
ncbi:MAG: hypothetical protein JWM41_1037 [Gemmatimonadetes bacterium]|nr:hypothetical protein [Gemmatimonadota bacterium]